MALGRTEMDAGRLLRGYARVSAVCYTKPIAPIGYTRVSTTTQDPSLKRTALLEVDVQPATPDGRLVTDQPYRHRGPIR